MNLVLTGIFENNVQGEEKNGNGGGGKVSLDTIFVGRGKSEERKK